MHASDRAAIDKTLAELRSVHEDSLRAVALHGEAATGDYRPKLSPLDLIVVVDEISPARLASMRRHTKAWKRRRIGTPLVLDEPYLARSFDVFPIEFIDIMDRHVLLAGESDPFVEPQIDRTNLRFEVEEHLRGKMLHLWEGYLRSGDQPTLIELLKATPAAFGPALRGLLYWLGEERPAAYRALVDAVAEKFDLDLASFHRIERARIGEEKIARADADAAFSVYLEDVRALVRKVDAL